MHEANNNSNHTPLNLSHHNSSHNLTQSQSQSQSQSHHTESTRSKSPSVSTSRSYVDEKAEHHYHREESATSTTSNSHNTHLSKSHYDEKLDKLCLAVDPLVSKMIVKESGSQIEEVRLSDFVIKINRKGVEQTRVFLLTDKAIYNVMPSNHGKCKRRIPIETVTGVTMSTLSNEFVIHIPNEYDYRFKSPQKKKLIDTLATLFEIITKTKLQVNNADVVDLKDMTLTKEKANQKKTVMETIKRKMSKEFVVTEKQQNLLGLLGKDDD